MFFDDMSLKMSAGILALFEWASFGFGAAWIFHCFGYATSAKRATDLIPKS